MFDPKKRKNGCERFPLSLGWGSDLRSLSRSPASKACWAGEGRWGWGFGEGLEVFRFFCIYEHVFVSRVFVSFGFIILELELFVFLGLWVYIE